MINIRITNMPDILKKIEQDFINIQNMVVDIFYEEGLKIVEDARLNGTYLNHTNNLISSIGFVVAVNGEIVKQNFKRTGDGKDDDGTEGLRRAKELVNEIIADYPQSVSLVVVAGMGYALAVEANGRVVLTGIPQKRVPEIKRRIRSLSKK